VAAEKAENWRRFLSGDKALPAARRHPTGKLRGFSDAAAQKNPMTQLQLYPLSFEPIFQYRLWGGRRLGNWMNKPLPDGPIGEVGSSATGTTMPAGSPKGHCGEKPSPR
jgi:hypothetical protein